MYKYRLTYNTIDEYIATFPTEIQAKLQTLRTLIKEEVPEATETISYGIPTFKFHGNLVHFAVYKNHIGFYPGSSPLVFFAKELTAYKTSKGTIQIPLEQDLPLSLIRKIVQFRVKENVGKKK